MQTWIVVEDEPHVYDLLLAMFELWGINGRAFVDGEEAVAWIDRVDREGKIVDKPELAFIDIRLPGILGPAVGERLRQSPILGDIPIVLTSANVLTDDELSVFMTQSGADAFIPKPLPGFDALKQQLLGIIAARTSRTGGKAPAGAPVAAPAAASHRHYPIYRTPPAAPRSGDDPAGDKKRSR